MMNRMKMTVALACALLTSGVAFAQLPSEVTAKFNEAAELINQKKFAEAIPMLETVLSEGEAADPESDIVSQAKNLLPECYIRKGAMAAGGGKFEDAISALNKADELADKYNVVSAKGKIDNLFPKVYIAYGAPAFNSKDYAKAIDIFSRAYAKFPNDTKMAMLLAQSYCASGEMAKGEEIYKNIIALADKHDKYAEAANQAKSELAGYLLEDASKAAADSNLEGVVKATDAVLAFDPTNGTANMLRLQAATNLKNYDAVIGFGEEAASTQPTELDKSNAYFLLGAAYQNKENKTKAIEMYKKVLEGPNAATAKAQIAELSK